MSVIPLPGTRQHSLMAPTTSLLLLLVGLGASSVTSLPNIVMITVENLGWSDVSWHNPEVIMPNIATLASSGVILGTGLITVSLTGDISVQIPPTCSPPAAPRRPPS